MIMDGILRSLVDRVVHFHDRRLISTTVAVVGSGKHRDNHSIVLPLIAFHDQLMGSRNKVQAIDVGILLRNVLAKGVTRSSW